ncbi:PhoH family protein [Candidatus Saccharibacteria bacterium]|nr:PhoH family protein [Candidatus Saccharibacteria bacterium]
MLSRIGNDSKIVILGDPSQTTNPHLNKTSNGLSYSASKLAGDSLAAVVSFDQSREIVRSPAAKHIAERLSSRKFMRT